MVFITIEDFYEKIRTFTHMSRSEELECAKQMMENVPGARERLIQSYLPMVAGYIRRLAPQLQTLGMVYYCQHALEKAVDSFDFFQDREPFSHRLSRYLRQAITAYIADH